MKSQLVVAGLVCGLVLVAAAPAAAVDKDIPPLEDVECMGVNVWAERDGSHHPIMPELDPLGLFGEHDGFLVRHGSYEAVFVDHMKTITDAQGRILKTQYLITGRTLGVDDCGASSITCQAPYGDISFWVDQVLEWADSLEVDEFPGFPVC